MPAVAGPTTSAEQGAGVENGSGSAIGSLQHNQGKVDRGRLESRALPQASSHHDFRAGEGSIGTSGIGREEAQARDVAALLAQQRAIFDSVESARGYAMQLRSAAKSLFSQAPEALGQKW
jgi:hypothetical protein